MSRRPPFVADAEMARGATDGADGAVGEVDVLDADDVRVGTVRFHLTAARVLEVRWSGERLAGFQAWSDR